MNSLEENEYDPYQCTTDNMTSNMNVDNNDELMIEYYLLRNTTRWLFQTYVVPFYTITVVIYLFLRLLQQSQIQKKKLEKEQLSGVVDTTTTITSDDDDDDDIKLKKKDQPVDLTGIWKLHKNENFEPFLEAQGVPWALRSAANRARPTHTITHIGDSVTIKITGIIETQTTYIINGPKVQVSVRGRLFEDVASYLPDKTGIIVCKRAIHEKYKVFVRRQISPNKQQLTLTSTVDFSDCDDTNNKKESITSIQVFNRA